MISLALLSVRRKMASPMERSFFFANSTPQKLPLWASVQSLRQKLPQVLGTTGFAAPEQYGIGRAAGGVPVLRGLRQRRLKLDDVIEEYTQEILDNWDDSPP